MKIRTIFNLLGPLSNPAGAKRQLLGVYNKSLLEPFADVLAALGAQHVWVVHGCQGEDEISLGGPTDVVEVRDGTTNRFSISPKSVGIATQDIAALKGDTPDENAVAMRSIFDGAENAYSDAVALNAGATLYLANISEDWKTGVLLAQKMLKTGAAKKKLESWVAATQEQERG